MTRCRMNFSEACEAAVNDQIMMELGAYYKYLSISSWLNRDDVALPGLAKYFYNTAVGVKSNILYSFTRVVGARSRQKAH